MRSIAEPARRHTASGREIEPHFVAAPLAPRAAAGEGIAIHIEGLEKSFGSTSVLKGIDLDITAGSFVAIVGKSGCGKSTLLRLLTGLEQPSAGSIGFDNGAGAETAPNSRIMFQEPRLLPWEKVAENVAVGLGGRREDGAVAAALADVQLLEKADEWPSRLSGGQRQRVALARALVSRPDFLAFDEPLGALDALTRITMQKLLERVWLDQGFTALLVTHDVSEAVALADRVVVLDAGGIALDLAVPLGRPRGRASAQAAVYEQQLLDAILGAA
jgi:sulfonate transport system ATP-binding protein